MTREAKKLEEQRQLNLLADQAGLPELHGASPDEEPDFLLTTSSDVLGIEISNLLYDDRPNVDAKTGENADLDQLFLSPPPTRSRGQRKSGSEVTHREKLLEQFGEAVLAEIAARGMVAEATIHLIAPEDGSVPAGKDLTQAATQLVDLLDSTLRTVRTPPAIPFHPTATPLKTFADIVHVLPTPGSGGVRCEPVLLGYVQDCLQGGPQARIVEKARKLSAYLTKCDRVWLVLVANGVGAASTVDLDRFDSSGVPRPRPGVKFFDRLYILDELKPAARLIWKDGRPA